MTVLTHSGLALGFTRSLRLTGLQWPHNIRTRGVWCVHAAAEWYYRKGNDQTVARIIQPSTPQVAVIGSRLRRMRKERNLTQADLARQIGIQQSDLSRMEKGEYRVSLDNLFKILGAFDLEISDFFGDQPEPASAMSRPLSHEDMQLLHLLRGLSPEAREEVQQFVEFKVRRERTERRATEARHSNDGSGS